MKLSKTEPTIDPAFQKVADSFVSYLDELLVENPEIVNDLRQLKVKVPEKFAEESPYVCGSPRGGEYTMSFLGLMNGLMSAGGVSLCERWKGDQHIGYGTLDRSKIKFGD